MPQFIVIAPTDDVALANCRIVAEETTIDAAVHKKVFGPDNEENCRKWVGENWGRENSRVAPSSRLKTYLTTGWTSYALVAAALFIVLFVTGYYSKWQIDSKSRELTSAFALTKEPLECKPMETAEQKAFIASQRAEIVRFAGNHLDTARNFYGYFYATYTIFSLFGLFAAISLAVIARKGIDEASSHLITVFLVSTGIVVSYQAFFGVFQQKSNIENNTKLLVSYARLNTRIETYCATGKLAITDPSAFFAQNLPKQPPPSSNTNSAPPVNAARSNVNSTVPGSSPEKVLSFYITPTPDEFINYVGWQMEQLKAVSITIDDTKIASIDSNKLVITQP